MVKNFSRYLGGDHQTMRQKQERVIKTLHPLPYISMDWRNQCVCGSMNYCKYRGRFYCHRCGKRINYPDFPYTHLNNQTFRQRFNYFEKLSKEQP
jgi:hypothetical protein